MMDVCSSVEKKSYKSSFNFSCYIQDDIPASPIQNICIDFFCVTDSILDHAIENRKLNLTSAKQLGDFTNLYNYCFYCDNPTSQTFKNFLFDNSTKWNDSTPQYRSLCPLFDLQMIATAQSHCDANYNIKDAPGYFYMSEELISISEYSHVLSFYDFMQFQESHFPFNCYCGGSSLSLSNGIRNFSFGFECDMYTRAMIPLVFEFAPIVLFFFLLILLVGTFMTLLLPIYSAVYREYKQTYHTEGRRDYLKIFDLRIQSSSFLFASIFWMCAQEVLAYLFNFYAFSQIYRTSTNKANSGFTMLLGNGLLRMVSLVCLCCSFAGMLVSWQHMTSTGENFLSGVGAGIAATGKALLAGRESLKSTSTEEEEKFPLRHEQCSTNTNLSESLSFGNKLILVGFYISLTMLLVSVVVLSFLVETLSTVFVVFIAFGMMYMWIFPIGFLFSGIRMYYKLKSMKENLSFGKLKVSIALISYTCFQFTRFMIFADVCFILLIMVGAVFMVTYLFGWDLFGIFIGINRTIIMDLTIGLMMTIEMYMLLNKKYCKDLYGACSCFKSIFRKREQMARHDIKEDVQSPKSPIPLDADSEKQHLLLHNGLSFDVESLPRISSGNITKQKRRNTNANSSDLKEVTIAEIFNEDGQTQKSSESEKDVY